MLEYDCSKESLADILKTSFVVYESQIPVLKNILKGLKSLHGKGYNHRNLTPAAVTYSELLYTAELGNFDKC